MGNRSTDVELLMDECNDLFRKQSSWSEKALIDALVERQVHKWTRERAASAIHRALTDQEIDLVAGRGDRIIYYASDDSMYFHAAKGLTKSWGRTMGLRNVLAVPTAYVRKGRHEGVWLHPDLLVLADPRRRRSATAGREIHAVEVEASGGFDVRSIYQAYEQGRGADYKWVFAPVTMDPGVARDRIEVAAQELGVGWVEMAPLTAPSQWITRVKARRDSRVTADARAHLMEINGVPPEDQALWLDDPRVVGIGRF